MKKAEMMENLSKKRNGYLLTSDVEACNISRSYLNAFVKQNGYERVGMGIYLAPDSWFDELYVLSLQNKDLVFCGETALYLHELTEREPAFITVAEKRGYNASHLRKKGIKVYQYFPEIYEMGITSAVDNFGNTLPLYDRERAVCDMIRHKKETELQTFQFAIKTYMQSRNKNVHRLMKYAQTLGIEEEVRKYTEVLL